MNWLGNLMKPVTSRLAMIETAIGDKDVKLTSVLENVKTATKSVSDIGNNIKQIFDYLIARNFLF